MRLNEATAQKTYSVFDQFLTRFLMEGKNYLASSEGTCLTSTSVNSAWHLFVEKYIEGSASFHDKVNQQFENAQYESKVVFSHAEWLWSLPVQSITKRTKKESASRFLDPESLNTAAFVRGFISPGQSHATSKHQEISWILWVFQCFHQAKQSLDTDALNADMARDWIEALCLRHKYGDHHKLPDVLKEVESPFFDKQLAMPNLLLHLVKPENYENIASNNQQRKIVEGLQVLLPEGAENLTRDEQLLAIRKTLVQYTGRNTQDILLYESPFVESWDFSQVDSDFSALQALDYKRALVLYGPPGTGKTHSAKQLARVFLTRHFLKTPGNIKTYFTEQPKFEAQIHRLQLHPNYTYEDFVAGIQIREGQTRAEKGYFLKLLDIIRQDERPHVLILDEINRVDLSRVFGEVFSALENRNEKIHLPIGDFELCIPDNLYVIGTMNEIDFSLERIDFALRRRFVWLFYGFNANQLESILQYKSESYGLSLKTEELQRFVSNATAVNEAIKDMEGLGEAWQIGHTFFAEIIDIFHNFQQLETTKTLKLFKKAGPVHVLWTISIRPMLEAFMGNLDALLRQERLRQLETLFTKND